MGFTKDAVQMYSNGLWNDIPDSWVGQAVYKKPHAHFKGSQPGFCLNRNVRWEKSTPLAVPSLDQLLENETLLSANFTRKTGNLPEMKQKALLPNHLNQLQPAP